MITPTHNIMMGLHHWLCLALLVTTAQAYKISGEDGEKTCTLEKSATNGENCFYEPECEDVCKDVFVEVKITTIKLLIALNIMKVYLMIANMHETNL